MRDGRTHKLERVPSENASFTEFHAMWQATLCLVSGSAAGTEFDLEKEKTVLGRGPDVDLAFDDPTMSKEHVAVEFAGGSYRVRDLGSRNGVYLDGEEVRVGDLENGVRFQIGEHVFQFLLEKRDKAPRTYVLPEA